MHLYFFVRGVQHQVNILIAMAQSQFFKWERTNLKTKKKETTLVQGALRPTIWGAYEYIFPEECLSEVISMFGIGIKTFEAEGLKGYAVRKHFPNVRKIPQKNIEEAKKIPNTIAVNGSWRGLSNLMIDGVHVIPIGIKNDNRGKMYGYKQEGL